MKKTPLMLELTLMKEQEQVLAQALVQALALAQEQAQALALAQEQEQPLSQEQALA